MESLAKTGSFIAWADSDMVEFSQGLLDIYGFDSKTVSPESFKRKSQACVVPQDLSIWKAAHLELSSADISPPYEFRIISTDGKLKWLKVEVKDLGHDNEYVGIVQDISSEKHVASELKAVRKELAQFIFSISHDLRAPVRHILGYTDWLISETEGKLSEESEKLLAKVVFSTEKLNLMINELLKYSRIYNRTVNRQRVNLGELVTTVKEAVLAESNGSNIKWELGKLPEIHVDQEMMKVVFENLFSNAVKFTARQPNPIIRVWAEDQDAYLKITVQDNGAGFNMEFADKLFVPFQRLHKKTDFDGVGIGLSCVKRVVKQHGGTIAAESEVNKGASFYITLPKN